MKLTIIFSAIVLSVACFAGVMGERTTTAQVQSFTEVRNSTSTSGASVGFTVPAGQIFRGVISCYAFGSVTTTLTNYEYCNLTKSSLTLWIGADSQLNNTGSTVTAALSSSTWIELQAGTYSLAVTNGNTASLTSTVAVTGTNYLIP